MKKIGVMTWYKYLNYGTSLQVTALCFKIKEMGYSPYVINYTPTGRVVNIKKVDFRGLLKSFKKKVYAYQHRNINNKNRNEKFKIFLSKNLNESTICNTYPELQKLNNEFDAFVCGSDQIWAPSCFDDKYFLSFVEDTNTMVSYAPSIGLSSVEDSNIAMQMKELINRFKFLSVREEKGKELIKNLCNKEAQVVLDPTLLLSQHEWNELIKDHTLEKPLKEIIEKNYILCYFLGDYQKYKNYVNKLSEKTGLPIYTIPVFEKQKKDNSALPFSIGPVEFLTLLKNAKHVCTDSFHGFVFSAQYHVPVSVFERFKKNDSLNQNSRIYNLANLLGLNHCIVDYNDLKTIDQPLNYLYEEVDKKLKIERAKSLRFLKESLCSAVNNKVSLEKKALKNYEDINEIKYTIASKDLCCGCGICACVCPTNALEIRKNADGFEHYFINSDKCIQCGRCVNICPFKNIQAVSIKNGIKFFAAKSKNNQTLQRSSSGGFAQELSKKLMDKSYAVVGCEYNRKKRSANHIIIQTKNKDDLEKLQGSKYLQSKTAGIWEEVLRLQKAIFIGTPCQVAGLNNLLIQNRVREKFVLVDLICHGIPSQNLWNKYLDEIINKRNLGCYPDVTFRIKNKGWRKRTIQICDEKSSYQKNEFKDDFYTFFKLGNCYAETCYECPYRKNSAADLRIGDYWGERFIKDKQGVSMVVAMTAKGQKLVNDLEKEGSIGIDSYPIEEYYSAQFPENHPRPVFYQELLKQLKNENVLLRDLRKKYCQGYERSDKINKFIGKVKRIVKK